MCYLYYNFEVKNKEELLLFIEELRIKKSIIKTIIKRLKNVEQLKGFTKKDITFLQNFIKFLDNGKKKIMVNKKWDMMVGDYAPAFDLMSILKMKSINESILKFRSSN